MREKYTVSLKADLLAKLKEIKKDTGRPAGRVIDEALENYFGEKNGRA